MTGASPGAAAAPALALHARSGGQGANHLVLLHGLGATGEVWGPLIDLVERAPDWRWTAVDLRGHGRSPWALPYEPAALADDLARLPAMGAAARRVILGHSLGGVVALALASQPAGLQPTAVLALGVKVAWTPEDIERMTALAGAPPKVFETREAAIQRYLKVSGLSGLVNEDDPIAAAGVAEADGGWRLAMDPRANGVGAPDMAALVAGARGPVHLARGEADPLVTADELRGYDPAAVDLPGLGHNAMVEGPARVWDWVRACPA